MTGFWEALLGLVQSVIDWFQELFQSVIDWLLQVLKDIAVWLFTSLQSVALWVYEGIVIGLAELIELIPAPDWLNSAASAFSAIPTGAVYFLEVLQFKAGLTMVASAYLIRFIIRRLPLIG